MRAGKLDKKITIQRLTTVVDEYGTQTEAWSEVTTCRAQLIQSSTEEFLKSAGTDDETAAIFRTRWIDGLLTSDRLVYASRAYDIKEIKELGRREGLDIRCIAQ
jgi:SPP1 family predicted phage head-tail adaptor